MSSFDTGNMPATQPAPRKLSGAALARLCRQHPAKAPKIAVDIRYGRIELTRPTATQAIALVGTEWADYDRAKAAAMRSRR